jgi:hypothetical protein
MKLVAYGSPPLYKFCNQKYDVTNGCNTLRIGTLWGFRKEENDYLRDEGEGKFEYKIRFPKLTPVSNEWISEFDVDHDGSAHIEHMKVNNGNFSISGVSLSGSTCNCWIFCVSMSGEAAGDVSKTHETKWTIPHLHVQGFCQFLASQLWNKVSLKDLPLEIVENHSVQEISSGLALNAELKPVQYTEREIVIDSEQGFPVEKIRELKANIPFIKPKSFKEEKELRFAFFLTFKGKKISINDNPKILELRPIDQFIAKLDA